MKAKSSAKTVFYCSECGNETAKWMGQCPACGAWNTLVEAPKEPKTALGTRAKRIAQPKLISELDAEEELRFSTGIGEFDRVLGGGAVRGSLVLVGGAPGIGKSTLLLQLCGRISERETILYVSGEESQRQLKMRAQRLGVDHGSIYVLAETDLNTVLATIDNLQPTVLIVDSIQTMYDAETASTPGSISQVRECTMRIMRSATRRLWSATSTRRAASQDRRCSSTWSTAFCTLRATRVLHIASCVRPKTDSGQQTRSVSLKWRILVSER